jgi:hypothetical protein
MTDNVDGAWNTGRLEALSDRAAVPGDATRQSFVSDPAGPIARRRSLELLLQPIACSALAVLPFAPRQAFRVFGWITIVGAAIVRRRLGAVRP